MQIYFRVKYSLEPRHLHSLALSISSPYIGLAFVNTMSQNHTTSNGILGWDQLDIQALNTMGQYHGKNPWIYNFRAQLGIRNLARTFSRAYATYPKQTRVFFVTHTFHHCFGLLIFLSLVLLSYL